MLDSNTAATTSARDQMRLYRGFVMGLRQTALALLFLALATAAQAQPVDANREAAYCLGVASAYVRAAPPRTDCSGLSAQACRALNDTMQNQNDVWRDAAQRHSRRMEAAYVESEDAYRRGGDGRTDALYAQRRYGEILDRCGRDNGCWARAMNQSLLQLSARIDACRDANLLRR